MEAVAALPSSPSVALSMNSGSPVVEGRPRGSPVGPRCSQLASSSRPRTTGPPLPPRVLVEAGHSHELGDRMREQRRSPDRPRPRPAPVAPVRPVRDEDDLRTADPLASLRQRTHEALFDRLGAAALDASLSEQQLQAYVLQEIGQLMEAETAPLSAAERQRLVAEISDDVLGHGPIERFLADDSVTEIMVNGDRARSTSSADGQARTDRDPLRLRRPPAPGDRAHRGAGRPAHRRVVADGRRPPARRLPRQRHHPAARRRRAGAHHPQVLARARTRSTTWSASARSPPRSADAAAGVRARAGSTSSSPAARAPARRRCSTCSRRSSPTTSASSPSRTPSSCSSASTTWSGSRARPPNIEGRARSTIRDLVRNALRMRPDRIIVGEVRGGEALDMLQAMNTGHDGSLSTVHANTPRDALARLETMVLMAGSTCRPGPIREQVASALDLIVHLSRLRDGTRRVTQVTEVVGMEGDMITLQDLFRFDYARRASTTTVASSAARPDRAAAQFARPPRPTWHRASRVDLRRRRRRSDAGPGAAGEASARSRRAGHRRSLVSRARRGARPSRAADVRRRTSRTLRTCVATVTPAAPGWPASAVRRRRSRWSEDGEDAAGDRHRLAGDQLEVVLVDRHLGQHGGRAARGRPGGGARLHRRRLPPARPSPSSASAQSRTWPAAFTTDRPALQRAVHRRSRTR